MKTLRIVGALAFAGLLSAADPSVATLVEKGPAAVPERAKAQAQADIVIAHVRKQEYKQAMEVATKLAQANPNDPIGYTMQGIVYFAKQEFVPARQSFEKALGVGQDYEPALMNLAELDLREKNLLSARTYYQKVLAKDAKNVAALLGMAKIETANKNEPETVAWLERAKAANPEANVPRLLLATRYMAARNHEKALVELTDAQRYQPNNPDVLELLGQAQLANGRKADAVSTYKKLVALRPQSPEAYRHLGAAQLSADDLSGATASYNKALELKPNYVDAISGLVAVNVRAHRPAEALKLAKKVQTVAPAQSTGFTLEGDVLLDQQQFQQAAVAYEKALALSQTGPLAIKRHAAQSRAGAGGDADANLQKWVTDHPDDIVASLYLAQELGKKGRNKQAIEHYQRVLKNDPKNLFALNNLANTYHHEKDSRALGIAEEAYRAYPDSPAVRDTFGWMLVEQGQTARGLELLQKAASQAPTNTEIRYHLAAALAKAGDKAKARKELEALLASAPQFPQREAAQALLNQL